MSSTCPRCNALIEPNSRFCTNCGAVLGAQNPYQQPGSQAQLPPWATSSQDASPYQQQQQSWSGQGGLMGNSLGFGSPNDAIARKVLALIAVTIVSTIVLLVLFGLLAVFFSAFRCLFLALIILLILVPWVIYVKIRSYIRRTVGRLWWFL